MPRRGRGFIEVMVMETFANTAGEFAKERAPLPPASGCGWYVRKAARDAVGRRRALAAGCARRQRPRASAGRRGADAGSRLAFYMCAQASRCNARLCPRIFPASSCVLKRMRNLCAISICLRRRLARPERGLFVGYCPDESVRAGVCARPPQNLRDCIFCAGQACARPDAEYV